MNNFIETVRFCLLKLIAGDSPVVMNVEVSSDNTVFIEPRFARNDWFISRCSSLSGVVVQAKPVPADKDFE